MQENQTKDTQGGKIEALYPLQEFDSLKSRSPEHQCFPTFPPDFPTLPTLGQIFGLCFDTEVLDTIVDNTNGYAEEKLSAIGSVQPWVLLNTPELRIFFAIQIYMEIVKYPNIEMYWEPALKHASFKYMSLVRYQQIKQFYHLSPLGICLDNQHWHRKVEPIASLLHQQF